MHPRDSSGHLVWNSPGENPNEFSPARAQHVPMPSPELSAGNQSRGSSFESFVIRRYRPSSKFSVNSLQWAVINNQSNFLKSSGVRPASFAIFPMVMALIGLCLGIVRRTFPLLITICPLSRATLKPSFRKTRTASR